jgi:radical SAM protein with 4Fe4S-binding SPASM domain
MARLHGDMSIDLFKQIIDASHPYVYFSWLHLFGEPLLNPHVLDMIQYASKNKVACGISTNATVLNEELAKNLCNLGLDTIIISIDATTKETYKKIRPGGDFSKVVKNTERFLNMPEHENIKNTIIQMVRMENNSHEVDDFIKKWKASDRNVHIKDEDSWAGHFINKNRLKSIERFPCRKLWDRLTIDWQGNISICCRDFRMQVKIGNIEEDSFIDIWNGNTMIELRRAHIKNQLDGIPLCKRCSEWIFSGNEYTNFESY